MQTHHPMFTPLPIRDLIASAITACGWQVVASKVSSDGGHSVRARRGNVFIAVESPAAGSSFADSLKKHRELQRQGVRGLWLLPFPTFAPRADFPAACITWESGLGYTALLPGGHIAPDHRSIHRPGDWAQAIPLNLLIKSALSGAFWFGTIREGQHATVRVDGGFTKCAICQAWTNLCTAIEIISPYPESTFVLFGVEQIPPHLLGELLPRDLISFKIGDIRKRYHRASKSSVILNSCSVCSAVQDRGAILELASRQQSITQFSIQVSKRLAEAAALHTSARWRVSLAD